MPLKRTLYRILCKLDTGFNKFFLYLDSIFIDKHKSVHNQVPAMNGVRPFFSISIKDRYTVFLRHHLM